jgi:hypothetical protein
MQSKQLSLVHLAEYHEFHIGHEVTTQSLEVIAAWQEHQLAT